MIVLGLFLCSGLFRLARFNVNSGIPTTSFVGLPTTFAAFFFANIIIYEKWLSTSVFASVLKPDHLAFLVTIVALLMISSLKFPSIKHVKLKITTALVLGLCGLMGAYAFIKGYPVFLAIAVTYIIASFAIAIFKEITKSIFAS
jgi:phosphatidylserine synthase